jgi:hypothetical protein
MINSRKMMLVPYTKDLCSLEKQDTVSILSDKKLTNMQKLEKYRHLVRQLQKDANDLSRNFHNSKYLIDNENMQDNEQDVKLNGPHVNFNENDEIWHDVENSDLKTDDEIDLDLRLDESVVTLPLKKKRTLVKEITSTDDYIPVNATPDDSNRKGASKGFVMADDGNFSYKGIMPNQRTTRKGITNWISLKSKK